MDFQLSDQRRVLLYLANNFKSAQIMSQIDKNNPLHQVLDKKELEGVRNQWNQKDKAGLAVLDYIIDHEKTFTFAFFDSPKKKQENTKTHINRLKNLNAIFNHLPSHKVVSSPNDLAAIHGLTQNDLYKMLDVTNEGFYLNNLKENIEQQYQTESSKPFHKYFKEYDFNDVVQELRDSNLIPNKWSEIQMWLKDWY